MGDTTSCPVAGLQNWMAEEWCHQLGERIQNENQSLGRAGERGRLTKIPHLRKLFLKTSNPFSLDFSVFYYGTQDRVWYSVLTSRNSQTNQLFPFGYFFLHVICTYLSFTMCSIPCLMNTNVQSLASEATPSLYRSKCTENLRNSNPQHHGR